MKKLLIILVILLLAVSVNAADLKWDSSTGADGYIVYFNEFCHIVEQNEVLDIDNTLNLNPGTTYTFTVTAWNIAGQSSPSNAVEYTTGDVYTPPLDNLPMKITVPNTFTITIDAN